MSKILNEIINSGQDLLARSGIDKSRFETMLIAQNVLRTSMLNILTNSNMVISDKIQKEILKVSSSDLNFFSKFIQEFSNDMPFFYGLFSIMFAVCLGISAAFIRRFFSNLRKKYFAKPAK